MTSKLKTILSLVVILILALVVAFGISKISKNKTAETGQTALPKATGNVDDLTSSLDQAAQNEDKLLQSQEDPGVTSLDSQAAGGFDQTYNPNEL